MLCFVLCWAPCRETGIAAVADGGADALAVAHAGAEEGVGVGVEGVQDVRGRTDDGSVEAWRIRCLYDSVLLFVMGQHGSRTLLDSNLTVLQNIVMYAVCDVSSGT